MATQKLQVERALKVSANDNVNIPEISKKVIGSTATATTSDKLVDSEALFLTGTPIAIGDTVYNTTDGTSTVVLAIDSETTLSLSDDIMADEETYTIYNGSTNGCLLYIGGAGDLRVLTSSDDDVTYKNMAIGFVPVHVKKVFSTGTVASDIIANW